MECERLLHFTGNGSCFNVSDGNTAAHYFDRETGNLLMIDCGENTFAAELKCLYIERAPSIDVLITHMHSNHIGSLPTLVLYCAIVRKIVPTIIFPYPSKIRQYLELTGCRRDMYNLLQPEEYERYKLNAILQEHVQDMPAYGYEISIGDALIYYSGDSRSISKDVLAKLMNDEYTEFYQDVSTIPNDAHMQLDKLEAIIPQEYRARVSLMHYDADATKIAAFKKGFNVL